MLHINSRSLLNNGIAIHLETKNVDGRMDGIVFKFKFKFKFSKTMNGWLRFKIPLKMYLHVVSMERSCPEGEHYFWENICLFLLLNYFHGFRKTIRHKEKNSRNIFEIAIRHLAASCVCLPEIYREGEEVELAPLVLFHKRTMIQMIHLDVFFCKQWSWVYDHSLLKGERDSESPFHTWRSNVQYYNV